MTKGSVAWEGDVSRQVLKRIRTALNQGDYDFTDHALEEMVDEGIRSADVINVIRKGGVTKTETDDPRGPRYTIVGPPADASRSVGVVGRFTDTGIYLIITVYEVTEAEEN